MNYIFYVFMLTKIASHETFNDIYVHITVYVYLGRLSTTTSFEPIIFTITYSSLYYFFYLQRTTPALKIYPVHRRTLQNT